MQLSDYSISENRYTPCGTEISNLDPFPYCPVSLIEIPVIDRISLARNKDIPVLSPTFHSKTLSFISGDNPIPLSSKYMVTDSFSSTK